MPSLQVKYLEFKAVDGSFVVRDKRVHKVPANDMEALRSPLMGMFEKRRARGGWNVQRSICGNAGRRHGCIRRADPQAA